MKSKGKRIGLHISESLTQISSAAKMANYRMRGFAYIKWRWQHIDNLCCSYVRFRTERKNHEMSISISSSPVNNLPMSH